ncbi:MAG: TylF/MycF/NovP-related O-methyltransferase [Akkermansiaceae bacterium]
MKKAIAKMIRSFAREMVQAREEFPRKRPAIALRSELHRRAMIESADLIQRDFGEAVMCNSRESHLSYAASKVREGLILEFGVFRGITINQLAGIFPERQINGFDSFLGLPEDWKGFRQSDENFDRRGVMPTVKSNVKLHQGWFEETLPVFMKAASEPVALAHVDCDIYSSTVTVLDCLAPNLVEGSIVVFDEFFNYPSFKIHEYKAFYEFVEQYGFKFEFISYAGHQAALRILGKG